MKVGIPIFIYPSDNPSTQQARDWARVMAVANKIGFAIVNPNSGPGPNQRDASYVRAVGALKATGATTFGYVPTDYGRRTDVDFNIQQWQSLWGVSDIFFDEASSEPNQVPFYAVKNALAVGRTILNPGVTPQTSRYLKCGDIICNFESSFENYMKRRFTDWEVANKDRMFHIVLSCPPSQLSAAINRARMYAGYVFITHENDDKPDQRAYKFLPSYWEQLVARVSQPAVPSWFSGIVARIIEGKA